MPDLLRALNNGRNTLVLCLVIGSLSIPGTAFAQGFCSEPVAPYCVNKDSAFDTRLQINRCEEDLANYKQQLIDYEQCISDQLESLREELDNAQDALEAAEENF